MRATFVLITVLLAPTIARAQANCTASAQSVVDATYRQVLERGAGNDAAGYVSNLTARQITVRELVRQLAKSPEHHQRFLPGNSLNAREDAVTYLYRHVLGRQPDAAGLKGHVDGLVRGSIDAVVDAMVDSPEYQQSFGDDTVPGSTVRYCGYSLNTGNDNISRGQTRFANMDTNGDGIIQSSEWTGTRSAFNARDWNRDGVLSGDETRPGARRNRASLTDEDFDPASAPDWNETTFRRLDRNGDNRLSSNEWYYESEFFRRADRNRDGVLVLNEFTGTGMDDDRDVRFEDMDTDRNGRVDRREWQGGQEAFRWLDRNNDGVLTRTEVVGEPMSRVDAFTGLDANRNGTLEPGEWRWSTRSFDTYDTNGDRRITRFEFSSGRAGSAPAR